MIYTMRGPGTAMAVGLQLFVRDLPEGFTMVEVGCYTGESTVIFAEKATKIYCVDPWIDYVEDVSNLRDHSPLTNTLAINEMAKVKYFFDKRTQPFKDKITVIEATSQAAATFWHYGAVDMVYIDARHEFAPVLADIRMWEPIVKPGGIIAGHDYSDDRPGVKKAVKHAFGQPDKVYIDGTWMMHI